MKTRSRLVWKLSAVVVAILAVAILLSGYVNNLIGAHYAFESARAFLRFNSESIINGIGQLMMSRNNKGIEDLFEGMSGDSEDYGDIRLVSHHSGEVVASRFNRDERGPGVAELEIENWGCATCHPTGRDETGGADAAITDARILDTVIALPNGEQVLSVMAPIVNEERCQKCHEGDPEILGFLNAEYSLQRISESVNERKVFIAITVLASLVFATVALSFMVSRLLARPINRLIAGTQRIAANELDFRFDQRRDDEIGVLEESFNTMTARIQAHRDELRSAMEYLAGIVENSADIIITVTPDGFIETFNRGAEQALGFSRVEVIGQEIETLFADPRERDIAINGLRDTDNVKNYRTRFLAKDGQTRNVLLTLSRLRDREGNSIGTIGISKDITQERELQDELRDAKEYLEGMVEHSADIIITVNPEGLMETVNRGAEEALGYRREELIGRRIESLYVEPRERRAIARMLEDSGNVKNYETRLLAKDGRAVYVLLTLSPLRDSEGRSIGTIGISKDVTQEKKLQRELIQSQKFATLGQAVTGIQHAIKNMLNILKGGAYMIRLGMKKDNPERIEEGWEMVEDGIERIRELSRNMLNYAKEWKLELQRINVDELVGKICESNRQTAADHGVTLRHESSDDMPEVLCDPRLLHMATTDIVVNAIDACTWKDYESGECPEVVLRNSPADGGGFFLIEISDNGCGMDEEIRRNIFTPFFSTKKTLGTGLGLALTARIINVHGGEIDVESELDRGATFRFRLPIDGPSDTSVAGSVKNEEETHGKESTRH